MITITISYVTLLQVGAYIGVGVVTSLLARASKPMLFVTIAALWPAVWLLALALAPVAWLLQRRGGRRYDAKWHFKPGRRMS